MNFRTANETAVDAITAFAIEYLDEDYLEIIDEIARMVTQNLEVHSTLKKK